MNPKDCPRSSLIERMAVLLIDYYLIYAYLILVYLIVRDFPDVEKPCLGLPRLDFPYVVFPVVVNVNLQMDGTASHSSNTPEYLHEGADSHSPPERCIPATPVRWPHAYSGQPRFRHPCS